MVLPAFGGATMSPRWPLPIGAIRSMIRAVGGPAGVSRRSRCAVQRRQFREVGRCAACCGSRPLTESSWVSIAYRRVLCPAGVAARRSDLVAPAQPVLPDLGEGQVGVGRPALGAGAADERLTVGDVEDARNRDRHGVLGRQCVLGEPGVRGGLGVPGPGVPGLAGIPGPPGVLGRHSIRSREIVAGQRALRIFGGCGH
jgi:hypothetical protein